MIGEIRDRITMQHALHYAESGHLCLSTLHANNASQAVQRILNFFPKRRMANCVWIWHSISRPWWRSDSSPAARAPGSGG